jgi:hypothetical protein
MRGWAIRRARSPLIALVIVVIVASTGAPNLASFLIHSQAAGPAYVSLLFGRSQWAPGDNCVALDPSQAPTLVGMAQVLERYGAIGTGTVVTSWVQPSAHSCSKGDLYASWADLATLRDSYGWRFVSDGVHHTDITKHDASWQYADSCGSLNDLSAHGHTSAWGLFAYPDNRYSTAVQTYPVSSCFAYGRTYATALNVRANMGPPWFQATLTLRGGSCNDSTQACYSVIKVRYKDPSAAEALVASAGPDEWAAVQGYKFVSGTRTLGLTNWDCSSADWHEHWTNVPELYCLNDYEAILASIPLGTVITDPATVAAAWGRSPG